MHFLELTYSQDATVPVPIFYYFLFPKSYTGNILRIGRYEARSSYFSWHETESKAEMEEGQEVATPPGGTGPP
jgi:hypothetical protein